MMEWENQSHSHSQAQPQPQAQAQSQPRTFMDGGGDGGMYVKVMTDEQMEVLRTQIAVYATICEQLVEMHKAITAQQDLAGVRLGNPYCDPLVTSIGGHKITARQRWTPTPIQLQILESIFDQGTGTPTKQKIKEITSELSQHGQISETNVYNWFQNRRARSKRKQLNSTASNNNNGGETEADQTTDAESPKEKKTRPQIVGSGICGGGGGGGEESNKVEPVVFQSDDGMENENENENDENDLLLPSRSMGQLSFIESMLETTNPRIDHLIGKMEEEVPHGSCYDPYHCGEDYTMT